MQIRPVILLAPATPHDLPPSTDHVAYHASLLTVPSRCRRLCSDSPSISAACSTALPTT
ncbi:hypothetical protein FRC08_013096, partial [Ceratobasidium sp. 394]